MVTAVAAFAAVVSYSHTYDLGRAHGQADAAARLLPLSLDAGFAGVAGRRQSGIRGERARRPPAVRASARRPVWHNPTSRQKAPCPSGAGIHGHRELAPVP